MNRSIKFALLAALISGFSVFANKIFITSADPLAFTTVKNIVVAVILTGILFFHKKLKLLKSLKSLKISEKIKLLLIGVLGGGLAFGLFFIGLSKTGAVEGNLIHKSLFIWTAILAVPFLKEKPNWQQVLGYLFIIAATFVVGGPVNITMNIGSILILIATIIWAGENILAKSVLKTVNTDIIVASRVVLGLPVLLLLTIVTGKTELLISTQTLSFWPLITGSLFLTAYIITWYNALKILPATTASSVLVLAPVITNLLNDIFIDRRTISIKPAFSLLIIVGLLLIILNKQQFSPGKILGKILHS